MQYNVRRATTSPGLRREWDGPAWKDAQIAAISHFHAKSSDHHPRTEVKMMYDDAGIYLLYRVSDRYVVCRQTQPQSQVCRDSCVEAFLQPKAGKGYFNFEVNCGGVMLLYYVTDPARTAGGLKAFEPVARELMEAIRVAAPMRPGSAAEIEGPVEWAIEYFVPNGVFERYVGPLEAPREQAWRGNFFKCADGSSHPHWGSWAPIGEELNFHAPAYFQPLVFED